MYRIEFSSTNSGRCSSNLIDLAQRGNDTEHTGPVEVSGKGQFPPKDDLFNTAYAFDVDYKYANGLTLKVTDGTPGIRFEGTEGWLAFDGWRAPRQASDPKILDSKIGPDDTTLQRRFRVSERRGYESCTPCMTAASVWSGLQLSARG